MKTLVKITSIILVMSLSCNLYAQENRYYIKYEKNGFSVDDDPSCWDSTHGDLWLHVFVPGVSGSAWTGFNKSQPSQTYYLNQRPSSFRLHGRLYSDDTEDAKSADKSYDKGMSPFTFEVHCHTQNGMCDRYLDAKYTVIVDDPAEITSELFMNDSVSGSVYACEETPITIKVGNYYNGQGQAELQIWSKKKNDWITIEYNVPSDGTASYTYTYSNLKLKDNIDFGVPFNFRTRKRLLDSSYSYSTLRRPDNNVLWYFPKFTFPAGKNLEYEYPMCKECPITIKIPSDDNKYRVNIEFPPPYGGTTISYQDDNSAPNANDDKIEKRDGYYYVTDYFSVRGEYKLQIAYDESQYPGAADKPSPCVYDDSFIIHELPPFEIKFDRDQGYKFNTNGFQIASADDGARGRIYIDVQNSPAATNSINSPATTDSITIYATNQDDAKVYEQKIALSKQTEPDDALGRTYYYTEQNDTTAYIDLPKGKYEIYVINDAFGCISDTIRDVELIQPDSITIDYRTTLPDCRDTTNLVSGDIANGTIILTALRGGIDSTFYSNTFLIDDKPISISTEAFRNDNTFTGLTAGNHTVTILDVCGNKSIFPIVVPAKPEITADYTETHRPTLWCSSNGEIEVFNTQGGTLGAVDDTNGTGRYKYSRINRAIDFNTSAVVTGYSDGVDTVYIQDDCGCIVSKPVTLHAHPQMEIDIQDEVAPRCWDGEGTVKFSVKNKRGVLSVQNRPAATEFPVNDSTFILTGITSGTYSCTIRDSYRDTYNPSLCPCDSICDFTFSFVIPEKAPIVITSVITPVSDKGSSTGAINADITSGNVGNLTLKLYEGNFKRDSLQQVYGTTFSFRGLSSGPFYTLKIMDSEECKKDTVVQILEPQDTLRVRAAITKPVSCYGYSDARVTLSARGGWDILSKSTLPANTIAIAGWDGVDYRYSRKGSTTWQNSPIFENLSAGSYTFYVKDKYDGKDSVFVSIGEPSPLTITLDTLSNVQCNGEDSGWVRYKVSGGTYPYRGFLVENRLLIAPDSISESIVDGDTLLTFHRLWARTSAYTFAVQDSMGCTTVTATAIITQPAVLKLAVTDTINTTHDLDNGVLKALATGGTAPYTYAIRMAGDTVFSTQTLAAGNKAVFSDLAIHQYRITVTDSQGCDATVLVAVSSYTNPFLQMLVQDIETTDAVCFDGMGTARIKNGATIDTLIYKFTWSNGDAGISSNRFPKGEHYVTVTDTGGYSARGYFDISQPNELRVRFYEVKEPDCHGFDDGYIRTETFGGTGSYTYLWSTGATTPDISNLAKGNYWVRVTDANGCVLTEHYTMNEPDEQIIDFGGDILMCPGNTLVLDGQNFVSYRWFTEAGDISNERYLSVKTAGHYFLEAIDKKGCTARGDINVEIGNGALKADLLSPSVATVGENIVLVELSNMKLDDLEWKYDPTVFEPIEADDNYSLPYILQLKCLQEGMYTIELMAYAGGCASLYYKLIEVVEADENEEAPADDWGYKDPLIKSVTQYPNPSRGTFTVDIELRETADVRLGVFDTATGLNYDWRNEKGSASYHLSYNLQLKTGVYVLLVTAGSERRQIKMIME
ncbi:hypothetical protein AGMMS4957_05270 [Bacteroidia bacterium]|nr:hypothetical protein AGMMS4957_05270 [Bacteroidia bacterium]